MMMTVKFDDFLKIKLEDENFKKGYMSEKELLDCSVSLYEEKTNSINNQKRF